MTPLLTLTVGAFLILLVEAFSKKKNNLSFFVTLALLIIAGYSCTELFFQEKLLLFNGSLLLDKFWVLTTGLIILTSFFIVLISKSLKDLRGEYYFFILMAALGMSLVIASEHLLMLFLAIELLSLCFYVVVTFNPHDLRANEGALKYFILGAFAAGFFVFGIALLYVSTGSLFISEIAQVVATQAAFKPLLILGIAFIVIALGFKMAAVPFHMWTPDAYEAAPTAVTAFMATGVKIAAVGALLKIFIISLLSIKADWVGVFYFLAVLTMTVGNLAAVIQKNLKRLLAYSAIAHAGYLLMAFVAFESASDLYPLTALFYYLVVYVVMNIGAFGVLIATGQENLQNYSGLGFKKPYLALVFSVFLLSLAGIPPTGGFLAKFCIFAAAVKSQYYVLTIIAVINAFIGVYYYTKVIVAMYMKESSGELKIQTSPLLFGVLALMFALTIYLGIFPTEISSLITQSLAELF